MRNLVLGLGLGTVAQAAIADVPRVAVDIAPVHSIVSAVMQGLGTPTLIVPTTASPHAYSLRPSEARALDTADIVVWMGPTLAPWLDGPIDSLAGDAVVLDLLSHPDTQLLDIREGAHFEAHDHGDEGHDDHDDHAGNAGHNDHDDHDDHADHNAHDDHDHHGEGADPHAWLDPKNATAWARAIAVELERADPENAARYQENVSIFSNEIRVLSDEIDAILSPVRNRPFVVFHDAYHYFEHRFDIEAAGAVSTNDAVAPSPARVAALRDEVAALGAVCALTEPQFNPAILDALGATRLGTIDPLGATRQPGADLYPQLLLNMATSLSNCLK